MRRVGTPTLDFSSLRSLLIDSSRKVCAEFVLDDQAQVVSFERAAPLSAVRSLVAAAFAVAADDILLYYDFGQSSSLQVRNDDELAAALVSYVGAPPERFRVALASQPQPHSSS